MPDGDEKAFKPENLKMSICPPLSPVASVGGGGAFKGAVGGIGAEETKGSYCGYDAEESRYEYPHTHTNMQIRTHTLTHTQPSHIQTYSH